MRLPKFRFAVLVGAIVGGLIPLLYFTVRPIQEFIAGSSRGTFLWPTSILLMATDGRERELISYEIIGISIFANIVLYVLVFIFIWSVGWVLRAWRASLRDGTTI
jgi:hypothetical protein